MREGGLRAPGRRGFNPRRQGLVTRSPPYPNRTCGFPAYGSPPASLFERKRKPFPLLGRGAVPLRGDASARVSCAWAFGTNLIPIGGSPSVVSLRMGLSLSIAGCGPFAPAGSHRASMLRSLPPFRGSRIPVLGFAFPGGPARALRRVAFTYHCGLIFDLDPSPCISPRPAVFIHGSPTFAQVLPAGFEPASNVRCEAHPGARRVLRGCESIDLNKETPNDGSSTTPAGVPQDDSEVFLDTATLAPLREVRPIPEYFTPR